MTDQLTQLTRRDPHTIRAWVVTVVDVTPTEGYCTIDPQDGDLVTEVPYWGPVPGVGSVQVALLFDGLLGVISTDGGGSGGDPPNYAWKTVVDPTTDIRPVIEHVMWVGGMTKPVNMATGDIWVKAV